MKSCSQGYGYKIGQKVVDSTVGVISFAAGIETGTGALVTGLMGSIVDGITGAMGVDWAFNE